MQASINNNKKLNCSINNNQKISCSVCSGNNIQADTCAQNDINANSTQRGPQGIPGEAATIQLGTVSTGAAGTDVIITNSGTQNAAVFNFTIPRGDRGEQGEQGIQGETGNGIASVELTSTSGLVDTYTIIFTNGNTTTFNVTNGQDGNGIASIQKTSTSGLVDTYTITFDNGNTETFTVTNGQKGDTGSAATISVGSTTTGAAGTSASVTNSGTSSAAVLDFVIPQGVKGDTGATGADGFSPTATVTKSGDTATITITDKNGTTTATVSDGSGASSISQLTDVDLTGLSNGDVLVYDSTSQEWKAEAQSGGVTDVEVNGESVVTDGVAEIDLTGYQQKLTAGTDLEILEGSTHNLPSAYTELNYCIANDAYINTGIAGNGYTDVKVVLESTNVVSSFFWGTDSKANGNRGLQVTNVGDLWLTYGGTEVKADNFVYQSNVKYTLEGHYESGNSTLKVNGINQITNTSTGTTVSSSNLSILWNNFSTAKVSCKLYEAEVKNGNTTLRHYIPALRNADNAVGFYDLINDNFVTSAGASFVAGSIAVATDTINFTNESGFVKDSELAEVATTGDYGDLINTPTIGNGTIIVNEGATEKGRFTLNQTGDTTINLTQVGAGMITFMQDGKQSGRMSANRATDMTITLKGLYDYESVNADMIGDNLEQANNNRVTGFSSSDYIVMREPITLPQYWEYDVDFSIYDTAESISDEQYIFSDVNNTFALKENEDAQLYETFTLYVNGTPIASDIEAESAYYNIKFIKGMDENYNIVGNGDTLQCYVYVGFSSGQSAQKELIGSFTASTAPTTVQTIYGVNSNHAKPLSDGSYIDFTKCFIDGITRSGNTVTKTRLWDGLVKTIDTKVNTWDLDSYVKSVNNELPDANGNVNVKGLYDYYIINASKQGSIVIDGANASGFSANNLVWTSYTAPSVNEVTAIGTQFTVNALNGSDQFIFSDSYNSPNFAVKIASNNCLSVAVGGTWYPVATAEIIGAETYQVRLIDWQYTDGLTSIGTYLYVYSPSLGEVIYDGLVTSNTVSLSSGRTFYFGTGNSGASPLNGSIDLSQTYIEQNNIASGGTFDNGWYTVWTGATPVIDTKADITYVDTQLATKADTDLSNLTSTASPNFDGQWVTKDQVIASNVSFATGGAETKTYSLASYLPNDNYTYEVLFSIGGQTAPTSGASFGFSLNSDLAVNVFVCRAIARSAAYVFANGAAIVPLTTKEIKVTQANNTSGIPTMSTFRMCAYRRVGTNS